jgi:uncharacterized protein
MGRLPAASGATWEVSKINVSTFSPAWARLRRLFSLTVSLAVLLFAGNALALAVPPLVGRINDRAELLSASAEQQLTARLIDYERTTGHQLAVLTIPSLEGDPIEDFSIHVVEAWKLGKKGKDDGVLVLVVSRDRKMRIEVGYGLEGELPDIAAGRIVKDIMAPRFRMGDYEGGIAAAVDAVISKTGGQATVPMPDSPAQAEAPARPLGLLGRIIAGLLKLAFFGVFGGLFILIWLFNRFGGPRGGGMVFGGGGGDYGGGGGGGFSGGGGGFGGGGASGSW